MLEFAYGGIRGQQVTKAVFYVCMNIESSEDCEISIKSETFLQWNECITRLIGVSDFASYPEHLMRALEVLIHVDIGFFVIFGKEIKTNQCL